MADKTEEGVHTKFIAKLGPIEFVMNEELGANTLVVRAEVNGREYVCVVSSEGTDHIEHGRALMSVSAYVAERFGLEITGMLEAETMEEAQAIIENNPRGKH